MKAEEIKFVNAVKAMLASDSVRRVLHTLWQAAGGVLVADLIAAHSAAGVKGALVAAFAAAFAALKGVVLNSLKG